MAAVAQPPLPSSSSNSSLLSRLRRAGNSPSSPTKKFSLSTRRNASSPELSPASAFKRPNVEVIDQDFLACPDGKGGSVPAKSSRSSHKGGSLRSRIGFGKSHSAKDAPPVPSLPPSLSLDLFSGKAVIEKSSISNHPYVGLPSSDSNQKPFSKKSKGSRKAGSAAGLTLQLQQQQQQGQHQARTPAAALAAEANASFAKAEEIQAKSTSEQRKRMMDALNNARLDVTMMLDLLRICGSQIRSRGLETLGLFRAFRVSESSARLEQLLQLFLIWKEPAIYTSAFPNVLPEDVMDRLSHPTSSSSFDIPAPAVTSDQARRELLTQVNYANIHDVVSLLKWGLRHLRLRASDFDSGDPLTWYRVFVQAERENGYPKDAFRTLLLPRLPEPTAALMDEMFGLMSNVAAYHTSNHMPASLICKILGFWLFGRIGVGHPPPTLDQVRSAFEHSSLIAEHLLLAHIRSQSVRTHMMPTRLSELVHSYPFFESGGASTPRLEPAFSTKPMPALKVVVKSENVVASPSKPRAPSVTLSSALDAAAAKDVEGGNGELWGRVIEQLGANSDLSTKGEELLIDEHSRILQLVDRELLKRSQDEAKDNEKDLSPRSASSSVFSSTTLASMTDAWGQAFPTSPGVKAYPSRSRRRSLSVNDGVRLPHSHNLEPLSEDISKGDDRGVRKPPSGVASDSDAKKRESADWRAFSKGGFSSSSDLATGLALDKIELHPVEKVETLPTHSKKDQNKRPSMGSLRRKGKSNLGTWSENGNGGWVSSPPPDPIHTVTKVEMISIDPSLSTLWQDTLLDQSLSCNLPPFVLVQLSEEVSNRSGLDKHLREGSADDRQAPPSLLPPHMNTSLLSSRLSHPWLLVDEIVIPPLPPTPPFGGDSASLSDKKSIFAPSIFAPSIRSVKGGLRRMSTFVREASGRKERRSATDEGLPPPLPSPPLRP
ncbi:hypothetical protein IE53DRAFT_362227 [Violaceomyces palustris]|uniref:Uncharacterized protein n=1 Tax=Violaceomyces palustris TaxID=1673888 RepID=A0ACD0NXZ5_9BASI|nr:hypothetical protein IE53DRAFT_362227 [Violaceomyces palustris]